MSKKLKLSGGQLQYIISIPLTAGERMVTRQITELPLHSLNPLNVAELLEKIVGLLPVKDLKTCRLVNTFWKDVALKPMRKKSEKVPLVFESCNATGEVMLPPPDGLRLEDMEKFLQCFSADPGSGLLSEVRNDIPCRRFEISTSVINEESSDRDKSIVANFLKAISPWATMIVLRGGKDIGHLLKGVEQLTFPSLEHTIFSSFGRINSNPWFLAPAFSPWMSIFITNAPKLEKLYFRTEEPAEQQLGVERDPSLTPFLQVLKHNKGLKIKELKIFAPISESNDLISLSESDLKLKCLTLRICNFEQEPIRLLPQLLKSQSESLEKFKIKNVCWWVAADGPFPILKNLTSLTLNENCPGMIDYAEQMPSLEFVAFEAIQDWSEYLNKEMKPAPSVKELCFGFRWVWAPPFEEEIREALRIFPNIRKLEIPVNSVQIVYNSLPNLEELTLNSGNNGFMCIDGMLTGLSEKGCQSALQGLSGLTHNFQDQDSKIKIGISHSPISVMKNLKMLRLGNELEISIVSICLALMNMPSLQILDLCERNKSPDEWIPSAVLAEFRKNRLILWKPVPRCPKCYAVETTFPPV